MHHSAWMINPLTCRYADDADKEQNAYEIKWLEPDITCFGASRKESKQINQINFKKLPWQTPPQIDHLLWILSTFKYIGWSASHIHLFMFHVFNLFKFIVNSTWEEIIASISFVYSSWVGTQKILKTNKQKAKRKGGKRQWGKKENEESKKEGQLQKKAEHCSEASCGEVSPH